MLLGLLHPDCGELRIDGTRLEPDSYAAWRNSIGYVSQEPYLFHDTIRANLEWGMAEVSEAGLLNALQQATGELLEGVLQR